MFEATAKLLYISLLPKQRGGAFMGSAAARENKWVGRARAETRKGYGTPFQALLGRQERLGEIAASFAEATEDPKRWNDVSMETMADAKGDYDVLPSFVYPQGTPGSNRHGDIRPRDRMALRVSLKPRLQSLQQMFLGHTGLLIEFKEGGYLFGVRPGRL